MDIRPLSPSYAVSPQIAPADLPAIKAAGYVTIIDNRPDSEIPGDLHTEVIWRSGSEDGRRLQAVVEFGERAVLHRFDVAEFTQVLDDLVDRCEATGCRPRIRHRPNGTPSERRVG